MPFNHSSTTFTEIPVGEPMMRPVELTPADDAHDTWVKAAVVIGLANLGGIIYLILAVLT